MAFSTRSTFQRRTLKNCGTYSRRTWLREPGLAVAACVVGGRAARGRSSAAADREQNRAIREWAKKAGKKISDRGRIPQEIVDEYHARAGR